MKNLLDELHELDNVNIDISPSFSSDVLKQIKREKRMTVAIRVISTLSCACIILMCVFVANKNGLFDRITKLSSNSISIDTVQKVSLGISSEDNETHSNAKNSNAMIDSVQSYNSASQSSSKGSSIASEKSSQEFEAPSIAKEEMDNNSLKYESINDEVAEDKNNDALATSKSYLRVYNDKDYINAITEVLNNSKITYTVNDKLEIEITDADFNEVSKVVENFVDVEIELKGELIILRLK